MEEMEKENLPVVVKDGKEGELGPATIWMSLEHIIYRNEPEGERQCYMKAESQTEAQLPET